MEGSQHRRGVGVASLILAVVLLVAGPLPAVGQEAPDEPPRKVGRPDIRAGTDHAKGTVWYEAQDGVRLTGGGLRRGGGRTCSRISSDEARATFGWQAGLTTFYMGLRQLTPYPSGEQWGQYGEQVRHYILTCDGVPTGYGWRVPRGPLPPRTVQEIARRIRDEIPMPGVELRANPAVGIAGLEAWFWAEGYAGDPIFETRDVLGRTFKVVAAPARYLWDFGDGTTPVGSASLGQAYPLRSEVRHVYESMSAGYPVQVRFVFDVRYQVDGGEWIELPSIERTASTSYRVGEIRTVVTARR